MSSPKSPPTSPIDAIRALPAAGPEASTRTAQIYEVLQEAIFDGDLPPGLTLAEKTIAERLDVSRTPVREALRQLEFDGLVRTGPAGTLQVASYSPEELEQLGMMRAALEGLSARSAAMLRTMTELAVLGDLIDEFRQAVEAEDLWAMVASNRAFHETIAGASRNAFLTRQLTALRRMIERTDQTTLADKDRQQETLAEHAAILAAIAAQDADAAEQATRDHFEKALRRRVIQAHARLRAAQRAQRRGPAE